MKISVFFLKYNSFERFVIFNDLGFLRRTGEWQAREDFPYPVFAISRYICMLHSDNAPSTL